MKLLVTGGAGFIGSNFIRYALNENPSYSIVNLDKLTYAGNLDNLADISDDSRYKFVKGDICDAEVVNDLMIGTDVVVNFAAESHVDRSIISPGDFIRTDINGTFTLLEAARAKKIGLFIQISTDEVYGSIEKGSFDEGSSISPNSPYSASKAGADLLAISYFKTYKVPIIITRSSNNYGPFQYPEKIIPLFITNLLEGKSIPLYGDGKNVRDWIYVLDNCKAIDMVVKKGKPGGIYNIGGGNEVKNIDLAKKILKIMGKPESTIKVVSDRPGHDRRYSINCSKLKKEIGFNAECDFDSALESTIKWYVEKEKWWKKIKGKEYQDYYSLQYENKI